MKPSPAERVQHIREAIDNVRDLLAGKSVDDFVVDNHVRAATERYLEIMSEASRHIPNSYKESFADVPWSDIAGIGNVIRHGYHKVKPVSVWETYRRDLNALSIAVDAILADMRRKS